MARSRWRRISELPAEIPVFPLDGAILLPGAALPLQIFEPRYLNMFDDAMAGQRLIGMVQTAGGEDRARPPLAGVGCVGRIGGFSETTDGKYIVSLEGVCRFDVVRELEPRTPYRMVKASYERFAGDLGARSELTQLEKTPFTDALRRYLARHGLRIDWQLVKTAPLGSLVDSLAIALPLPRVEKQALVEAADTEDRLGVLLALMEMDSAGLDDDDEAPSLQ